MDRLVRGEAKAGSFSAAGSVEQLKVLGDQLKLPVFNIPGESPRKPG